MRDRSKPSRFMRGAAAAALVATLGACELILAEGPPETGQTCGSWRGGCVPVINVAEEGKLQAIRSESQIGRNVSLANSMKVPQCETAPWICQLEMGGDVLSEKYFDRQSTR